ncbi:MAG: NnrU family protein [Pseudomonadales bacterium]|jgi:uncharacterized membrane protein
MFYIGWTLFFGIHAGMLVPSWRNALVEALGESRYKSVYALVSLVGLVLLIMGYGQSPALNVGASALARETSLAWMAAAWFFMLSANLPGRCRALVRHPMTIGIMLWGIGHALINPHVNAWLLFLGFAGFVLLSALTARARGKGQGSDSGSIKMDVLAAAIAGLATWLSYRFHEVIAGVPLA